MNKRYMKKRNYILVFDELILKTGIEHFNQIDKRFFTGLKFVNFGSKPV